MSHIFLTGLMGAGKSTIGRLLAERRGLPFVDIDAEIESHEGMSIPRIFETCGECGFRDIEHEVLETVCHGPSCVVATGGGIVIRQDNRALLKRCGTVVYLAVTAEEALARIGSVADRPLLATGGHDTVREILRARLGWYTQTADFIVNTVGRTPDEVASAIEERLSKQPPAVVRVGGHALDSAEGLQEHCALGEIGAAADDTHRYDVVIGTGLIAEAGFRISGAAPGSLVAIVADSNVWRIFGSQIQAAFDDAGVDYRVFEVSPGEQSKSWNMAGELLERFAACGLDRESVVAALGGGVTGDLAGFVAATYMRGVKVVQLPTTMLAQVDSSIGGKTGVDLRAGKNLAGAFWPPSLVLADLDTLVTLPDTEFTNGLVEAVKGLLIGGGDALERFEENVERIMARDTCALRDAVRDAVAFKADVVTRDLRESGLRECLNFGHTFGHALEVTLGYGAISHGLAVAEGIRFASALAGRLGIAESDVIERTGALLSRIGAGQGAFDTALARVSAPPQPEVLLAAMKKDKKSRLGTVRFVLLEAPGLWQVRFVADSVLTQSLEEWAGAHQGGPQDAAT